MNSLLNLLVLLVSLLADLSPLAALELSFLILKMLGERRRSLEILEVDSLGVDLAERRLDVEALSIRFKLPLVRPSCSVPMPERFGLDANWALESAP